MTCALTTGFPAVIFPPPGLHRSFLPAVRSSPVEFLSAFQSKLPVAATSPPRDPGPPSSPAPYAVSASTYANKRRQTVQDRAASTSLRSPPPSLRGTRSACPS